MQLPEAILNDSSRPPPAPIEFAGEWVAWNAAQTEIIAHGEDLEAVYDEAVAAGYLDAIIEKVPVAGTYFIGGMMRGE